MRSGETVCWKRWIENLLLRARALDGLDLHWRHAGLLGDRGILLGDRGFGRLVLVEAAEHRGRYPAVGALRAVFIDDIEQHEVAARSRSRFPRHCCLPPF